MNKFQLTSQHQNLVVIKFIPELRQKSVQCNVLRVAYVTHQDKRIYLTTAWPQDGHQGARIVTTKFNANTLTLKDRRCAETLRS